MEKTKRWLGKNYEYLLSILILALLIVAAIYTFLLSGLITDKDKALTVTLSSIGILLAVFQFVFTQINNQKKKYFDLRYSFYKETVKQLQLISDIIQEGMLLEVKAQDTRHKLMSAMNEFSLLAKSNEEYLFKNLSKKEKTIEINKIIERLMRRTTDYAVVTSNADSEDIIIIENMNWHNSILELLRRFNIAKYEYLSVVRHYL